MIPHFGKGRANTQIEQLIVNRSMDHSRTVRTDFYLLNPPTQLQQANGLVSWSTAGLLNIPAEVIRGFNVYADGVKLNRTPIPIATDRQSFQHADLKGSSEVTVSVEDRHGKGRDRRPTSRSAAVSIPATRASMS